ncbi:MAG: type II toxin-antitoxin system VapC family toxin [Gammaproteobacteria bacterium]
MAMVFVDSNIPMYLVGAEHANRAVARRALETLVLNEVRLVTDAEVFQEILHRYAAIGRRDAMQPAFDALGRFVDEVFAIDLDDVELAKSILLGTPALSARDAIHVAVMQRHGVREVLSFDAGFDRVPGLQRLPNDPSQ